MISKSNKQSSRRAIASHRAKKRQIAKKKMSGLISCSDVDNCQSLFLFFFANWKIISSDGLSFKMSFAAHFFFKFRPPLVAMPVAARRAAYIRRPFGWSHIGKPRSLLYSLLGRFICMHNISRPNKYHQFKHYQHFLRTFNLTLQVHLSI